MNESLNLQHLKPQQFAVLINEIDTGIVLNTSTLERCREGRCDYAVANSYTAALALAESLISKSTDVEAMILNAGGKFIRYVRSDGTS